MLEEDIDNPDETEYTEQLYQGETQWRYGDMIVCFKCSVKMADESRYKEEEFKATNPDKGQDDCDYCGIQIRNLIGEY